MKTNKAIFGAGCFWGAQYYFDQVPGVIQTRVGYIGGHTDNPTYEQVCSHTTGHAEAVEVTYDPKKVSYGILLRHFFRMHDPTQLNRQGPDIGDSYRSAIFYKNEDQRLAAEKAIERLSLSNTYESSIVTSLERAGEFWRAEDYHQKYTQRTGQGMCHVSYMPFEGGKDIAKAS
ncbi:MAG: peptide-methionine (S)-S-oxide reductase MsrA [Candidatus Saccharimonadales bacterium]